MDKLKTRYEENPELFVDLFFEFIFKDAALKAYFKQVGMRRLKAMFVGAFPVIISGEGFDLEHLKNVHKNIRVTKAQLSWVVDSIVQAVEYHSPLSDEETAELKSVEPKISAFLPTSD